MPGGFVDLLDPPIRQSDVCICSYRPYCMPHTHAWDGVHLLWLCKSHDHVVVGEPFDPEKENVRPTEGE